MKILVFLQNAWYHDGKPRAHEQWVSDLWSSHTGKRLKKMLPAPTDVEIFVDNASPKVGDKVHSVFEPDLKHIDRLLVEIKPDVVLACGACAKEAVNLMRVYSLDTYGIPVVYAPHPAWRQLSDRRCGQVKSAVEEMLLTVQQM